MRYFESLPHPLDSFLEGCVDISIFGVNHAATGLDCFRPR